MKKKEGEEDPRIANSKYCEQRLCCNNTRRGDSILSHHKRMRNKNKGKSANQPSSQHLQPSDYNKKISNCKERGGKAINSYPSRDTYEAINNNNPYKAKQFVRQQMKLLRIRSSSLDPSGTLNFSKHSSNGIYHFMQALQAYKLAPSPTIHCFPDG